MARRSNKNTQSKSSGLSNRDGRNTSNTNLTSDQENEVKQLKEELSYYQQELADVKRKRRKIKSILDNFEKIVVGDIVLDILPDENSEEILNSLIIPKTDIINRLNGIDTSELATLERTLAGAPAPPVQTVSGYTNFDIDKAINLLDKVFKTPLVKELISRSSELGPDELYLPIYFQQISKINSSEEAKEILEDILTEIEDSLS